MKVSLQRSCFRSSSIWTNVANARSHVPSSNQPLRRRQQVEALGYSPGSARHCAPVQRIHKMPSKQRRLEMKLGPPLGERLGAGSIGSITFHCSSVSNLSAVAIGGYLRQSTTQILSKVQCKCLHIFR
jgi:hypothetical protein